MGMAITGAAADPERWEDAWRAGWDPDREVVVTATWPLLGVTQAEAHSRRHRALRSMRRRALLEVGSCTRCGRRAAGAGSERCAPCDREHERERIRRSGASPGQRVA